MSLLGPGECGRDEDAYLPLQFGHEDFVRNAEDR